jgi:serine/threonine protein kinase
MMAMDIVGQHLGKYEILAEIGSGGFGTVYRARDVDLDRLVALKVLHPELLRDSVFLQRFRREAKTAANLDHPGIVTIYEIGEVEGRHYIAMRLLEGQSLSQVIDERAGSLTQQEILAILDDVAAALDYAHRQDVVHRDVKPNNVVVTPSGAVLTDFGIVRVLNDRSQVTATGQAMGHLSTWHQSKFLGVRSSRKQTSTPWVSSPTGC